MPRGGAGDHQGRPYVVRAGQFVGAGLVPAREPKTKTGRRTWQPNRCGGRVDGSAGAPGRCAGLWQLARIDHRFGNEGDFGRPERFSESFAIDPVQVE